MEETGDSGFFGFMNRIGDIIFLNLIFILTSIPIVTMGISLTALYTVTLKMARDEEGYVIKDYLKAFRTNWKHGLCVGIVLEVIFAVLGYDAWVLLGSQEGYAAAGFFITAAALIIVAAVAQYLFPLMARYDNPVGKTVRNAALLAISRLPYTVLLMALAAVPVVLVFITPYAYIYVFFAGISLGAFLQSRLLVNVFGKIEKGGK